MKVCSRCLIEKDDNEFRWRKLKCWECVKEQVRIFRKSEEYLQQQRDYKIKNKEKIKSQTKKRVIEKSEKLTDRYIIEQLLNVHNPVKYTLEYLKQHPEIIEMKRVQILSTRIKRNIEEITGDKICTKCLKRKPSIEFRYQKKTDKKRGHWQRWCKGCVKEYNKQNWQKIKKHE